MSAILVYTRIYRLFFASLGTEHNHGRAANSTDTTFARRELAVNTLLKLNSVKSTLSNRRFVQVTIIFIIVSGVRLSPHGTAATTGLLYQLQMIDDGNFGVIGGMKIGR
jgi:hypothetical protein